MQQMGAHFCCICYRIVPWTSHLVHTLLGLLGRFPFTFWPPIRVWPVNNIDMSLSPLDILAHAPAVVHEAATCCLSLGHAPVVVHEVLQQ